MANRREFNDVMRLFFAGRLKAVVDENVPRKGGAPIGRVLSSQWCRCLETARLAFGTAEPWSALNSSFRDRTLEADRTREVRALASERPAKGNLVLVTHQVNIGALTGVYPVEGELVVLTPLGQGNFRVAGTMRP